MAIDREDDDALSWGDEKDPTYVDARSGRGARDADADAAALPTAKERRAAAAAAAGGDGPVGAGSVAGRGSSAAATSAAGSGEAAPMSSVTLVALGVLGGIYLLYTVGWFLLARANITLPVGALNVAMYQLRLWVAVAAPALWFGATLLFTRNNTPAVRILTLLLGALFLLPLPIVLGV